MNHEMIKNKVYKTIFKKLKSDKTQTGTAVSWMVVCRDKQRALLSLALTNPANYFPPLVLLAFGLPARKYFLAMNDKLLERIEKLEQAVQDI